MSGVNEIRSAFLDYFAKNGHEIVPSSPLVPRNDPTLMFVNAGMVQFKNVFTGVEKRDYTRAVTSQKCVRAGGKHNDLDNVGYTTRHHTFFEMLGNFSFGDYFKALAIELSWNLITKEFKVPKNRLLVTVYSEDDEAFDLWKKIAGLSDDKIIRISTHDNFWAMGETGPCGPCSEIFYDHGDHIPGGPPGSADEEGDRFVEIWNLVFMQFEQLSAEDRVALPRPSIDTGMGLERIAAVLQGTHDNYETDLFKALIGTAEEQVGRKAQGDALASFKVIADHLRASGFLIADGVLPSNEGRGYVLRRIMRRAMRHGELLGVREPLMWKLVPTLVREMGQAFPELVRGELLISETLKHEEKRFRKTLERGLKILDEESAGLVEGDTFSGDVAFKLYDTFGFPLDLTQDALRSRSIDVDLDAFNVSMERQRAEARKAWAGSGEAATEAVWFGIREEHGATEFLGYDTENAEGIITAIVFDGAVVAELSEGQEAALVCNQTPFYGESGGQCGDHGKIRTADGAVFCVTDTQKKLADVFVHLGTLETGSLKTGVAVELEVDHALRSGARGHHSATHLLHEAIRRTLGEHVIQKGSLVEPGRLRFDFSHSKQVSPSELDQIEALANRIVEQNDRVTTRLMNVDDAIERGAMALFGEKYKDEVRVLSMGQGAQGSDDPWSLELCGGTHVSRTGDIGLIKIISESAVAAGVRRIEALAGEASRAYMREQLAILAKMCAHLKVKPAEAAARVAQLIDEKKQLERQLAEAKKKLALSSGPVSARADQSVSEVGGVKFLSRVLHGISPKDLRSLIDEGKKTLGSGVVAIVAVADDGKAGIAVGVTEDLTGSKNAVELVRAGSAVMGGKGGGGRPDMAQAGGPDGAKAQQAIDKIKAALAG